MRNLIFLVIVCAMNSPSIAQPKPDTASTIIAMERAALDRWGKGDPDGFLEISDPDVVYFDPFQARRVNGLEKLRAIYNQIRGKVRLDSYQMIDPKVQVGGDIAVLTFNFVSKGDSINRWNATEVYRRTARGWRIIHSHWSFTQPALATAPNG